MKTLEFDGGYSTLEEMLSGFGDAGNARALAYDIITAIIKKMGIVEDGKGMTFPGRCAQKHIKRHNEGCQAPRKVSSLGESQS